MDEAAFDSALLLASDMTCNRSVTLAEVLRAAIARYLECQWRPMEEAPKNVAGVLKAALAVLKAVDFNHETKETPLKYTVPWLEIVALRKALIAAGIKTEGEYKPLPSPPRTARQRRRA